MKAEHQRKVNIVSDAIARGENMHVELEDVPKLKDRLLSLKHNGRNFVQILETTQAAAAKQTSNTEKMVFNNQQKDNRWNRMFSKFLK